MDSTDWFKQTKPLFPELEWNKPERRDQAGRLLIIGGNVHNISGPAKAYELTTKTGIGSIKMVLPDRTKPLLKAILPEAIYLPSTSSGEFSSDCIHELLEYALWADTILLPGNLGRNSQTSIVVEELLRSLKSRMILSCDAIEAVSNNPNSLLKRQNTTIIASFAQLQKLLRGSHYTRPITYGMDLIKLIDVLQHTSRSVKAELVTFHQNQFLVAVDGKVSSTKVTTPYEPKSWRIELASYAACYQTWSPEKSFEALTHSVNLL